MKLTRRSALQLAASSAFVPLFSNLSYASDWSATEAEARGQEVFFNAWAGAETINAYIAWAGEEVSKRFGVKLTHVKITDTAEVVKRVRDEVMAGKVDGSVDLVWINGANFKAMKSEKLLFGPFAEKKDRLSMLEIGKSHDDNTKKSSRETLP